MLNKREATEISQGQLLYVLTFQYHDKSGLEVIGVYENEDDAKNLRESYQSMSEEIITLWKVPFESLALPKEFKT